MISSLILFVVLVVLISSLYSVLKPEWIKDGKNVSKINYTKLLLWSSIISLIITVVITFIGTRADRYNKNLKINDYK